MCQTAEPGKTLEENLASCPPLAANQPIIKPVESPIKPTVHLQVMYGNLAPEGSVGKITGKEGLRFQGTARCFDSEEAMLEELGRDPSSFKVGHVVQTWAGPKRHQFLHRETELEWHSRTYNAALRLCCQQHAWARVSAHIFHAQLSMAYTALQQAMGDRLVWCGCAACLFTCCLPALAGHGGGDQV